MEIVKNIIKNTDVVSLNFGNEIDSKSQALSGSIELDIENQIKFVEYINTIIDEGMSKILIFMENISYIDSSGLWAIFESYKKATQRNGEILLINPRKDVKRVLDITKISTKIHIFQNESDALIYFNSK